MAFEIGEKHLDYRKTSLLNQYNTMKLLSSETEQGLIDLINSLEGQLYIKAMYFSPTSNSHVAYILTTQEINQEINKEVLDEWFRSSK